jgi:hypothetical protein
MSDAKRALNATLEVGDGGSPEVFTAIAEVHRIKPGTQTAAKIDVTHLTSTGNESKIGLIDYGTFEFGCNFLPSNTQQSAIRAAQISGATLNFKLKGEGGTPVCAFSAVVETFEIDELTKDGAWKASIGLAVSGSYTWS